MNDIVERLNEDCGSPYCVQLRAEAAGEIERLRAERKNCPAVSESEYVRRLEDEIERLQKEWLSLYGVERMRFEAVRRMTAEIERLRAEVDGYKALVHARERTIEDMALNVLKNKSREGD